MIERTLILIKHDGVYRCLIGEIVKRFESVGLKIVGMKMVWADENLASNHYQITQEWAKSVAEKTKKAYIEKGVELKESDMQIAKKIQNMNSKFLREGPVIAIVFEGPHAIEICRKIVGHTEPRQALPGTIRGDLALESYQLGDIKQRSVRNLIHASSDVKEAKREIELWFTQDEIHPYENIHDKHIK